MQTQLADEFKDTPEGQEAEAILRKCVHCGFCTATCPTYQLLGDELDGPRGRIYLIKQVLEGAAVTRKTQQHLDRCLTCRNCETTCPSGVQYGQLVEIGRAIVDRRVPRPAAEQAARWMLRTGLTSAIFAPALGLGRMVRPLLPRTLRNKVPGAGSAGARQGLGWPTREHPRKVLLLLGCVQPALLPHLNPATARVLDAAGIQSLVADGAGCCGAVRSHLGDAAGGLNDMRRNIDAWWPLLQGLGSRGKVEAIVINASACALAVKDYGHALARDPDYAEKARQVSALARDLSEFLPDIVAALKGRSGSRATLQQRLAFHPPCTLQHGQRLRGGVERHLKALGFDVEVAMESHLCCGSAGTYSVLQPELAQALRDRKLQQLAALEPETIVSANVGCIQHLQSGTATPVRHWVEVIDSLLPPTS
jgi:glycolate oxidase iron-sulfur subunit